MRNTACGWEGPDDEEYCVLSLRNVQLTLRCDTTKGFSTGERRGCALQKEYSVRTHGTTNDELEMHWTENGQTGQGNCNYYYEKILY